MRHFQESSEAGGGGGTRAQGGQGPCRPRAEGGRTQGLLSASARGTSGRASPRGDRGPAFRRRAPARPPGPGRRGASSGSAGPGRVDRGEWPLPPFPLPPPTGCPGLPAPLSLQRAELRERVGSAQPGRAQDARTRASPPPGAAARAGGGGARPGGRGDPGGRGQADAAAAHRGDRPGAQEVPLGGVQEAAALGPAGLHPGPQGGLGLRGLPGGAESGNCSSRSKDERQVSETSYRSSLFQPKVQQTLPQTLPQHPRLHHPHLL